MDELTKAFYEERFEKFFLKNKGLSFQDFFSEIMEKNYPADFIRVRPWGNIGDRKCDGYLKSKRILFQVYAPNELTLADTITKIDQDFQGALPFWKLYFNTWIFVHNSRDGLSPDVTAKLLSLERVDSSLAISSWGYEEIRHEVFQLPENELIQLLGTAPSNRAMAQLRYEDIRVVLINVSKQEQPAINEIRPVPGDKIKYNLLSNNVEIMLSSGMRKANLVKDFFRDHPDPRFGDRVAKKFNEKYREIQKIVFDPDEIFLQLQDFTAGESRSTPGIECATLAVLAYLFEECEIFERPPEFQGEKR